MTDTAFYDDMFSLATELMNDFGSPATLRKIVRGEPEADGKATETPTDFPCLAVRVNNKEMMNNMELKGDLMYCVKSTVAGVVTDLILHAGGTFEIVAPRLINPEGNRLMIGFYGVTRAA